MPLFRFPHRWAALTDRVDVLRPILGDLDDRDRFLEDYLALTCPVGKIDAYGGSNAPDGWLLCDGASYARATKSALFAVIGTTYGSVDSTHFNVPDLRDRTAIGKSGTKALGATGGSADAITVSHDHEIHRSNVAASATGVDASVVYRSLAGTGTVYTTTATAGSSGTNANLPPYVVVNYIIRY